MQDLYQAQQSQTQKQQQTSEIETQETSLAWCLSFAIAALCLLAGTLYWTVMCLSLGWLLFHKLTTASKTAKILQKVTVSTILGNTIYAFSLFVTVPPLVLKSAILAQSGLTYGVNPIVHSMLTSWHPLTCLFLLCFLLILTVLSMRNEDITGQMTDFVFTLVTALAISVACSAMAALIQYGRVWAAVMLAAILV